MFMIIVVSSLITLLALILGSATYLVALIWHESDDESSTDTLAIDARDFTSTPAVSPLEVINRATRNILFLSDSGRQSSHKRAGSTNETSGQGVVCATQADTVATSGPNPSQNLNKDTVPDAQINPNGSSDGNDNVKSLWDTSPASQKSLLNTRLGVSVGKQLYDDFDQKEMQLGGTGLHWCKTRKSLDRLIKVGLPLEILNKRQETALHVAVRRRKLQIIIGLLCNGANLEGRNDHGETPIIVAAKVNDIFACQLLLVFDADFDAKDNSGHSARHYAAGICDKHKVQSQLPSAAHLILAMLNEIGAKRCVPEQVGKPSELEGSEHSIAKTRNTSCSDGCSSSGSYDGNSYNRWQNYQRESLYKRNMFLDVINQYMNHKSDLDNKNANGERRAQRSRLLCIDGGGMRGVIVCQLLIELEKYLTKPISHYFDWVGGTSVGAFLGCAICCGIGLKELRKICFDVKDEIFNGNKPYNSKFLERVLKRTFGPSARMSDVKEKQLAVTTVVADRDPCQLKFFRNYMSPTQLLELHGFPSDVYNNLSVNSIVCRPQNFAGRRPVTNAVATGSSEAPITKSSLPTSDPNLSKQAKDSSQVVATIANPARDELLATPGASKDNIRDAALIDCSIDENEKDPLIWQAVRASAAAPFFFKPYGPYLDGGIISNNPTLDMLTEFFAHQKVKSFLRGRGIDADKRHIDKEDQLDMVLSLGTGRGRIVGKQAVVDFGQVASGFSTVFSPRELLRSIRAARDLFKKLMHQSCHTEDYILDRAQAWCASLGIPYFRVNPPLVSIFSIDDKRDEQLINALWQTKLYTIAVSHQLKELGDIMENV